MKRAQNSDSKTHVKKRNPTSRTEIRRKSLKYLFLETPCIVIEIMIIGDENLYESVTELVKYLGRVISRDNSMCVRAPA